MRLPQSRRAGREGFTLIELLVVMAIIAVLIALTAAGIFNVYIRGYELQNRSDISQLSTAVGAFQSEFKVTAPPPSRIRLVRNMNQYAQTPSPVPGLDNDSRDYILRMYPNCRDTWATTGINWSPLGASWNGDTVLTGEQCLVFFLGGLQQIGPPHGVHGFSTNPNNPMAPGGTRKGPFFEFKSNRLEPGNGGFMYYKDVFGAPVVYFSSYKTRNGYNRYGSSDSTFISGGAYHDGAGRYLNPDSFQIISAGKNKTFGPGGTWTVQQAAAIGPAGGDDFTNFHDLRLGASGQ